MMPIFDFTMEVEGLDLEDDEQIDSIYEACNDDSFLYSHAGTVYVAFHREALSLTAAIEMAAQQLASCGVRVVSATYFQCHDEVVNDDVAHCAENVEELNQLNDEWSVADAPVEDHVYED